MKENKNTFKVKCITNLGGLIPYLTHNKKYDVILSLKRNMFNELEYSILDDNGLKRQFTYDNCPIMKIIT